MTRAERELYNSLNGGINHADALPVTPSSSDMQKVENFNGSSFDFKIDKKYYKKVTATGVISLVADTDLSSDLKTGLPVFLFAASDYNSGYAKMRKSYPPSNEFWKFEETGIWGKDKFDSFNKKNAAVVANLSVGDVVLVYSSAQPGSGATSLAIVTIRSSELAAGTLLTSTNSDKVGIAKVRITLPNNEAVYSPQNQQNLAFFNQSIFGKSGQDSVAVSTSLSGFQFAQNIIDVSVDKTINKEQGFQIQMEFTTPSMTLTWAVTKAVKV